MSASSLTRQDGMEGGYTFEAPCFLSLYVSAQRGEGKHNQSTIIKRPHSPIMSAIQELIEFPPQLSHHLVVNGVIAMSVVQKERGTCTNEPVETADSFASPLRLVAVARFCKVGGHDCSQATEDRGLDRHLHTSVSPMLLEANHY